MGVAQLCLGECRRCCLSWRCLESGREAPGRGYRSRRELSVLLQVRRPRLPEFVGAFGKAKDGYQFSIKAPFADAGNAEESEFMWVHVCRVDFDAVHGTLLNDPEFVKSYKYDDVVRVPMELIVDWVYTNGEKSVGDFTAKVLDEAAKAALPPPAPYSPEAAQNDSSSN